jgi:hypothetical protein
MLSHNRLRLIATNCLLGLTVSLALASGASARIWTSYGSQAVLRGETPMPLRCDSSPLVIRDAYYVPEGDQGPGFYFKYHYIIIQGEATPADVGKIVRMDSARTRAIGVATVEPDGSFRASIIASKNERLGELTARLGSVTSAKVSVKRRIILKTAQNVRGNITLKGNQGAYFARKGFKATVQRRSACNVKWRSVASAKFDSRGRFTKRISSPDGAPVEYRVKAVLYGTRDAYNARSKKTRTVYSVRVPVVRTEVTRAGYVAAAEKICRQIDADGELSRRSEALEGDSGLFDVPETVSFFQLASERGLATVAKLRTLPRPTGDEAQLDAFWNRGDTVLTKVHGLADAYYAGDWAAVKSGYKELEDIGSSKPRYWPASDFNACDYEDTDTLDF